MAAPEVQNLRNHVEARTSAKEAGREATLISAEPESSAPCLALLLVVKLNVVVTPKRKLRGLESVDVEYGFASLLVISKNW